MEDRWTILTILTILTPPTTLTPQPGVEEVPDKPQPSAMIIPFGKHKGRTVADVLATDPQYAEWMLGQAWFADRFAELHAALLSRGAATDDTPEHNAIQARFLDPLFQAAFVLLAIGPKKWQERQGTARENELEIRQHPGLHKWQSQLSTHRSNIKYLQDRIERCRSDYTMASMVSHWETDVAKEKIKLQEVEQILADSRRRAEATPVAVIFGSSAGFERRGVDVVLRWWFTIAEREARQPGSARGFEDAVGIEIKPSLGDDFPTVMRQMERLEGPAMTADGYRSLPVRILVIDQFAGRLPLETVRQMFAANGRRLVTVREIEAEIANARALLATGQ
jgi:hypothetical protein